MEFYCGIPDKVLVEWLGKKKYIAPADEGEAVCIGSGYWLGCNQRATVFMSADGFCNALNPLTSYVIPEKIEMNIVIGTGRQEPQHKIMSDILENLIKLIPYDPNLIHFKIIRKP